MIDLRYSLIYLGDSGVDMQTSRAAGCYSVGALWGFRPREELLKRIWSQ